MKKGSSSTSILILVLILGLSLMLYPSFSDYWNSMHQSRAITTYAQHVAELDTDKYEHIWKAAKDYNDKIRYRENVFLMSDEELADYVNQLNLSGDGIMGYIEIPLIGTMLPIYHGVEESVLQTAIGHIEWTSLPTGGAGTHCVLSGHRGLPSAKLFSDLDKLVVGDLFMLRILDELITYEVDRILVVEPHDVDALLISDGQDLCTLVTCTPYGVNSHRLLIRGHRVPNTPEAIELRVTSDALQIEPMIVAPVVAVPLVLVFLMLLGIYDFIKKRL